MTDDDKKTPRDEIEEAEIVNDDNANASTPLLSLESTIKTSLPRIDKLKEEIRTKKEMLDDALNNDQTYKEHTEKAKEAAKIKSQTKQELLKQPSLAKTVSDLKDLREELKELQSSLSDYLSEYARLSGSNEIEDENGEVREIVYIAKLVKRK